jgi:hypothetical protein
MQKKSPSGSLCPYYYRGGELHPLKYGSLFSDKARLLAVMKAEEEFILNSQGAYNRRIWIDLYETKLDAESMAALVRHIAAIRKKVCKLCFVGCSNTDKRKIKQLMVKDQMELADRIRFFEDPEEAKKWLVSEGC